MATTTKITKRPDLSFPIVLRWLTPPVITLVLYWPSLELPFFWDDVANFRFMRGLSLVDIWTTAESFPYYRPLGFTVWRAWGWIFGQTNTTAFHSLNLTVLTIDGWLVGALATRLAQANTHRANRGLEPSWYGWIAGSLLTAFPFAAVIVPLVASFFHLLVTLLSLAAALAFLEYQHTKLWRWGVLCLVCTGLAPFAHESGVTTSALLMAFWLASRSQILKPALEIFNYRRLIKRIQHSGGEVLVISLLLNLLFLPLWTAIPKARSISGLPSIRPLSDIWHNTLFFLEALTFPVQPLATHLNWNGPTSVLVVGVLALTLVTSIMMRFGLARWLIVGTIYMLAGSLPSILTLHKLYVVVSPRLMFFPAPGAVLLWCGAVAALSKMVVSLFRRDVSRPAAVACIMAIILTIPAMYIWSRVQLHVRALAPVWGMVHAVQAYPDERHLIVNPTTWLASAKITYPIVHDGVVVIPEYHNPAQLTALHTGSNHVVDGVNFPLIADEPEAHYFDVWGDVLHWEAMAAKLHDYDKVWLVTYGDGNLGFSGVGYVKNKHTQTEHYTPIVSFASGRVLLEHAAAYHTEHGIQVILDWRMERSSTEEVFVHALDCDFKLLGQADGPPLGRMFPLWLWQPHQSVRDVRTIPLLDESLNHCYRVEVGLFDPLNGVRLEAMGNDGQLLPNDVMSLQVTSGGS